MHLALLTLYSACGIIILYRVNILLAGRPIKLNPGKAALYVGTMAASGVVGEVVYDTFYNTLFGHPLWVYHLYPIHNGYTSLFSLVLWGGAGLHIYMQHGTLKKWHVTSHTAIALVFCVDAILLELVSNISYKLIFKDYLFYYLPGDLWHITSLQTLPPYIIAGFATLYTFDQAKSRPKAFLAGSATLALLVVGSGLLFR